MSADHHSSKYAIASHASLPMLFMLFIEMALNFYAAPQNALFLSPYLLAFFVLSAISFTVFLKGQICPGQQGRLAFALLFLAIFALGNLAYLLAFTPKHSPMVISAVCAVCLPSLFFRLPEDETLYRTILKCGLAINLIGVLLYLLVYWVEVPSAFNYLRANNFAQLLLGILLAGWYLMLAKSRLEQFLKLLVKLAIFALILNYFWSIYAFFVHFNVTGELNVLYCTLYALSQFAILAILGWLLLGKNIKSPTAWSLAVSLALLYPFANL